MEKGDAFLAMEKEVELSRKIPKKPMNKVYVSKLPKEEEYYVSEGPSNIYVAYAFLGALICSIG